MPAQKPPLKVPKPTQKDPENSLPLIKPAVKKPITTGTRVTSADSNSKTDKSIGAKNVQPLKSTVGSKRAFSSEKLYKGSSKIKEK